MKTLLPRILLLVSAGFASTPVLPAGLTAAQGGRLTDYVNWFAPEFDLASDDNFRGIPYPRTNQPTSAAMANCNRAWSGWGANWSPGLSGPLVGMSTPRMKVEFLFLGETAGWWGDIGYRLNGTDHLLADGVQAVGGLTRRFGDYIEFLLDADDALDFFVTGSQVCEQDGHITIGSSQGGKFYVFDKGLNSAGSVRQSYFGSLVPLTSVRGTEFLGDAMGVLPFTVVAFEDMNLLSGRADLDYNDFLFAFRTGTFSHSCGSVPEPAGLGVLAAATLAGLVAWRYCTGS